VRILFFLLLLFGLPNSWPASLCENFNSDLKKLASTYYDRMKTLSDTLMTSANVTTKINPDISEAKNVQKGISDLVNGCKGDDNEEDELSQKIEDVLSEVKELDADLQKMGTFDNLAVNTARINAIEKSNKLIASLQDSVGDSNNGDNVEKKEDDEDEDDERSYKDAKDDDEEDNDSDDSNSDDDDSEEDDSDSEEETDET
jgi:hypothetical protein